MTTELRLGNHEEHEEHEEKSTKMGVDEVSDRVRGCAIEVHHNRGLGLLESVYGHGTAP